jgi:hypothetical protein
MTPSKILVTGATGVHRVAASANALLSITSCRTGAGQKLLARTAHRPPRQRDGCRLTRRSAGAGPRTRGMRYGCAPRLLRTVAYQKLVQASMRCGIRRFVHISSIAVHGPNPDQACSSESGAVIGRYPGEDYSKP